MAELISIPLKKPSDVDLIKPLQNIIKSTYSAVFNKKDFIENITEFSKLRKNALWRAFEKYESSLEVIYRYYDQICVLEGKIPASELQIPFKWKDAFDRTIFGGKLSLTISTLAYEKVCVLFNIAALQSTVGSTQSLESDEGLKLAAKLFQFRWAIPSVGAEEATNRLKMFLRRVQLTRLRLTLSAIPGLLVNRKVEDFFSGNFESKISAMKGSDPVDLDLTSFSGIEAAYSRMLARNVGEHSSIYGMNLSRVSVLVPTYLTELPLHIDPDRNTDFGHSFGINQP